MILELPHRSISIINPEESELQQLDEHEKPRVKYCDVYSPRYQKNDLSGDLMFKTATYQTHKDVTGQSLSNGSNVRSINQYINPNVVDERLLWNFIR